MVILFSCTFSGMVVDVSIFTTVPAWGDEHGTWRAPYPPTPKPQKKNTFSTLVVCVVWHVCGQWVILFPTLFAPHILPFLHFFSLFSSSTPPPTSLPHLSDIIFSFFPYTLHTVLPHTHTHTFGFCPVPCVNLSHHPDVSPSLCLCMDPFPH